MTIEGVPEYLRKVEKGEYVEWMDEEKRRCRACYYNLESWGNVLEKYTGQETDSERVDDRIRWILVGRGMK